MGEEAAEKGYRATAVVEKYTDLTGTSLAFNNARPGGLVAVVDGRNNLETPASAKTMGRTLLWYY